MFLFFILILFSVLLEGTVVTVPLTLVMLLVFAIFKKDNQVFAASFTAGVLLDLMLVRTFGATAIFFLLFSFLTLLYQRKYEIKSYPFVIFSSFAGSLLYLLVFNGSANLFSSAIASIAALGLFGVFRVQYKELRKKI